MKLGEPGVLSYQPALAGMELVLDGLKLGSSAVSLPAEVPEPEAVTHESFSRAMLPARLNDALQDAPGLPRASSEES
jgi:hypothetical protein